MPCQKHNHHHHLITQGHSIWGLQATPGPRKNKRNKNNVKIDVNLFLNVKFRSVSDEDESVATNISKFNTSGKIVWKIAIFMGGFHAIWLWQPSLIVVNCRSQHNDN